MTHRKRAHTILFFCLDFAAAALAWLGFYLYRKYFIEPDKFGYQIPFETDQNLFLGMFYIPLYWILLYYLSGFYNDVWRRSRIKDLSGTFTISVVGVVLLFFLLLLDDEVRSYKVYYNTVVTLFSLHFGITALLRILSATWVKLLIGRGKIVFNTLIVGNNARAVGIVKELQAERLSTGYHLVGFADESDEGNGLHGQLPYLGRYSQLSSIISSHRVEEVILTIESSRHAEIIRVTNVLEYEKVILKIVPDIYDVVSGSVKMQNVLGTALIEINHEMMPQWQKVAKRMIDIVASLLVLILISPLMLGLMLAVKLSSPGPVFFRQIRIGWRGKPFRINKFRSMYVNSETQGPALASLNDRRITPVGKWLRKYRLDELPQFWNVLIGEMSLVGPRPERKYFIDQIVKVAPHFKHLHRVRPGITSWGQVKYGYAENVEQMVERLKFDILYIENMSIAVDIRIMIYTIRTILLGKGK
jgi:exopolysaccharide biosynthesis polyprenyl glycosylphosphotransferase